MINMFVVDWATWKSLIVGTKQLLTQYNEDPGKYYLFAAETEAFIWSFVLVRDGGPDVVDFETNYKPTSNQALTVGEDKVVDAVALRDAVSHNSTGADNRGAIPKTILVQNSLNQPVTIQLQGDREPTFANAINVGGTFVVAATTAGYATISDYMPYLRIQYICAIAPASGNLSVYLEKVRF